MAEIIENDDEIFQDKDEDEKELLTSLKKKVENSWEYFRNNYKNFYTTRWAVFNNMVDTEEQSRLTQLGMPVLDFNVLEGYISRYLGEFAKSEPGIEVHQKPDGMPVSNQVQEIVEGILRNILLQAKRKELEYGVYRDCLTGGFSVMKIFTEYSSPMSMHQDIKLARVFDPTLCGFDPLARDPDKGDGEYCFENFPMELDRFLEEYKECGINEREFKFYDNTGNESGFNWTYRNNYQKFVMVSVLSQKKRKKIKIAMMSSGVTIPVKKVEEYKKKFKAQNPLAIEPTITKRRLTEVTYVCRYTFCENKILKIEETDFTYLPLIFVDGNSAMLRGETGTADAQQVTRATVHQALSAQKLKNLIGQTLAFDIANEDRVNFLCPEEALPDNAVLRDFWNEPFGQRTLYYKSIASGVMGAEQVQPPQRLNRYPFPSDKAQIFFQMDQAIQSIMGSFDVNMQATKSYLSGEAIDKAATANNATGMPYIVNFLTALTQAANVILDLIPKYMVYPRTVGIISKEGKKGYANINGDTQDSPKLDFSSTDLGVVVEAGVNFEVQQQQAIQTLIQLIQAAPQVVMPALMKSPQVLFDNLNFRGADILKNSAEEMAQQAQQNPPPPPPNPMLMKEQNNQQRLVLDQHELVLKQSLDEQRLELDKFNAMTQRMKVMNDAMSDKLKNATEIHKIGVDSDIAAADILQRHTDSHREHERHLLDKAVDITQGMEQAGKEASP